MSDKTTLEVGGLKFTGGKLFLVLTILSTLGGAAWGGFEFYNDYRNMKAKIEKYVAPDLSGIYADLEVVNAKLDEALDYSKDIKNGLRDDIVRLERIVDQVEDDVNKVEDNVREQIDLADQQLIDVLGKRMTVAERIGDLKKSSNVDMIGPDYRVQK